MAEYTPGAEPLKRWLTGTRSATWRMPSGASWARMGSGSRPMRTNLVKNDGMREPYALTFVQYGCANGERPVQRTARALRPRRGCAAAGACARRADRSDHHLLGDRLG